MIKKIIPIFVLIIFLSLVIAPTVSACKCWCNIPNVSPEADANKKITFIGSPATASECVSLCESNNMKMHESSSGCNSSMLQGENSGSSSSAKLTDPLKLGGDIDKLWIRIIKALLGFVAIASLVTFVYAGFMFLISTGNAEKVKKAKDTVIYAVLGIFLSIASYSILSFILNVLERK